MQLFRRKLFLLLATPIVIIVAINLWDNPLSPGAKVMLETQRNMPLPNHLEGYKFSLAISIDRNKDPDQVGQEVYDRIRSNEDDLELGKLNLNQMRFNLDVRCQKVVCTDSEFAKLKTVEDREPQTVELGLSRYKKLIGFGGLAGDLEPGIQSASFKAMSIFNLSHLMAIKNQEAWNLGNKVNTVEWLFKERDFYLSSLKYEQPLLFTMISLKRIESIQKTLQFYFKTLSPGQKSQFLPRVKVNLEFEELKQKALAYEMKSVRSSIEMIKRTPILDTFAATRLDARPLSILPYLGISKLFTSTNASLNEYYDRMIAAKTNCKEGVHPCDVAIKRKPWDYIYNPIGKLLVQVLQTNVLSQIAKMSMMVERINKI